MIEHFGKHGEDVITGFRGTICGHCVYNTGCSQVLLVPRVDKEGKRLDGEWFDENRVTIFERSADGSEIVETPAKILLRPGQILGEGTEMPVGGDIAAPAK